MPRGNSVPAIVPAAGMRHLAPTSTASANADGYDVGGCFRVVWLGYAGRGKAEQHEIGEAAADHSLIPALKRRSARVVATTPLRQEMVRRLGKAGVADRIATDAVAQRVDVRTGTPRLGKLHQQTPGQGRPSCLRLSLASQSSPFSTILPIA